MKITERDLEKLGFQRELVSTEESGTDSFYYFVREFPDSRGNDHSPFSLISNASDERLGDEWNVSVFDYSLTTKSLETLEKLIDILEDMQGRNVKC